MIIEKKICILDKEYDLIYKTYSNSDVSRASLKILYGKIHVVSLHIIALGFILVNGKNRRVRLRSVLEAKVQFIKFLINDN